MSGRIVSSTYRNIIDDVVNNCRPEFDEMGIEQAVLDALQASWEAKLLAARVTDFSSDPRLGPAQAQLGPAPPRPTDHDTPSSSKKDKPKTEPNGSGAAGAGPSTSAATATGPTNQDDEINSDLDDSEDEADAAEVADMESGGGDLVIALYDKVQRVKNKWKVTLKDGVVSVEGKDYLFHKCSGEFEW